MEKKPDTLNHYVIMNEERKWDSIQWQNDEENTSWVACGKLGIKIAHLMPSYINKLHFY